jgi:hypothetical protein
VAGVQVARKGSRADGRGSRWREGSRAGKRWAAGWIGKGKGANGGGEEARDSGGREEESEDGSEMGETKTCLQRSGETCHQATLGLACWLLLCVCFCWPPTRTTGAICLGAVLRRADVFPDHHLGPRSLGSSLLALDGNLSAQVPMGTRRMTRHDGLAGPGRRVTRSKHGTCRYRWFHLLSCRLRPSTRAAPYPIGEAHPTDSLQRSVAGNRKRTAAVSAFRPACACNLLCR